MLASDYLFQDRPDGSGGLVNQAVGAADVMRESVLDKFMDDEWAEKLQSHVFGKPALVEFQLRADHDHGAAGVIHALSQKILAESPLLALQHIGQRPQGALLGRGGHRARATADGIINQSVHRLLKHALFVPHDHFRRLQLQKFF